MNEEEEQKEFVERENRKNISLSQETNLDAEKKTCAEGVNINNQECDKCDSESENKADIEPDSLNCDEVSQNNEESTTYDNKYDDNETTEDAAAITDEEDYTITDEDDDAITDEDNDKDDIAEEDDEFDEVPEECEFNDLDDENEHWYNGPRSGEYVWHPYSEDDKTRGEYVWQPAAEVPTETYWGNRSKSEEWIPQEVKEKKKKRWIPSLVARKEMGKTVWYYKLPSTTKTNNIQKDSLKHIPKLIRGKGSQRWFSQIVSTKDKKKETIWYCKLTPIDTEQQENVGDSGSEELTQATNDLQASKIKTNPEQVDQIGAEAKNPLKEENSKNILQNSENHEMVPQATYEKSNKTKDSVMVLQEREEQATKTENSMNLPKTTEAKPQMKKQNSHISGDIIPKLIQVQIWNKKPVQEDQPVQTSGALREQPKSGWFPKLGKANKEKCTKQPQTVPNQKLQMDNKSHVKGTDNCLLQIPQMTMSLISDDEPQEATAVWYEDTAVN